MSLSKECHMRTIVPYNIYTFKWSISNFSNLSLNKEVKSCEFQPMQDILFFSTLRKLPSAIVWRLHNKTKSANTVQHDISIVDLKGKVLFEKIFQIEYDVENSICQLIKSSTVFPISELESANDITLICRMKFNVNELVTSILEKKPERDYFDSLKELSHDLKTIYEKSINTDIILNVGGTVLKAHKAILSARSPVFARMLEHKWTEDGTNTIHIIDVEVDVLRNLLLFIYSGVISDDTFDSAFLLYYAADKYDMADLRMRCQDTILAKLCVDNVCQAVVLADRHSDEFLQTEVLSFINIYQDAILVSDEWKDLVDNNTDLAAKVMKSLITMKKESMVTKTDVVDTEESLRNLKIDSIEDAISNNICTFKVTGRDYALQDWYHCSTCNMHLHIGVCVSCLNTCHKNHRVYYAKRSIFFCDCGATTAGSCKAMI